MSNVLATNKLLSGIEIIQDEAVEIDEVSTEVSREFYLPATLTRGSDDSEVITPSLSGFSVLVKIDPDQGDSTILQWTFERYIPADGWELLDTGTIIGAQAEAEKVWIDVYFSNLVAVDTVMFDRPCRITVESLVGTSDATTASYESGYLTLRNTRYPYTLIKGQPQLFDDDEDVGVVYWDPEDGAITYHPATKVTGFWLEEDDLPTWRLFTASGDSGVDFLTNNYRHALFRHSVQDVSTLNGAAEDRHWLSKPNPSQFAVERQFFDIGGEGFETVVDSILIDPITPNVFFNLYYTNEGNPGTTVQEWDDKLWIRVPKIFKAEARKTHQLPSPIRTRYVKIEYSHLQPRTYDPGLFQQPVTYQKYPKWVMDYFQAELNARRVSEDQFIARRIKVPYDPLRIAYGDYVEEFLDSAENLIDQPHLLMDTGQIDPAALGAINYSDDYRDTEGPIKQTPVTTQVSSVNRDLVVDELSHPLMYFFLTARHRYSDVRASFEQNRAYFVGIREIAFLRNKYTEATDTKTYIEIGGDNLNLARNDFVHNNTALVISDD